MATENQPTSQQPTRRTPLRSVLPFETQRTTRAHALAATPVVLVAQAGDPDGTRVVTSIVALLAVLGVGLVMLAVWLVRATRPDPEVLAPLEVMGDRSWRRADPVWQRRKLDEVRPEGAEPLEPSVAPPDFDEAFELGPTVIGFDDLQDRADDPDDATVAAPREAVLRISTEPPPRPQATASPARSIDPLLGRGDGTRTPTGIQRPTIDDLPDRDVDPALLAAAMAELDAELQSQRRPGGDANGDRA